MSFRLHFTRLLAVLTIFALEQAGDSIPVFAQQLESELLAAPAAQLAAAARTEGDPQRGAILFHQAQLACGKCHQVGGDGLKSSVGLGPDLTKLPQDANDVEIVTSILKPSEKIRKGYESTTIITSDGRTIHGVVAKRTKEVIELREAARFGELTRIPAEEIEEVRMTPTSLMPAGQVNQLASRQQFLDLVRYVLEVRDGGVERARLLQPPPSLIAFTLPEYEERLDHAGFIRDWNAESLARGEKIYQRVCANCHGTREMAGSLPTSLRFAEGKFKNGSDPLSMYRTLTRGFGLMAPQTWMAPVQKYDVIHYIRETYLKPHNRTQFVEVTPPYLAGLPRGNTRGPAPSNIEPWVAMDYGPSLIHTYEFPNSSAEHGPNLAYKGIAIRLDQGPGGISRGAHWMVFDHDTFRVAGAWSLNQNSTDSASRGVRRPAKTGDARFIDWAGIQFDGRHGIHPRVAGEIAWTNPVGPGWGNPADGSFADNQRVVGRDGRKYGPLPREWARFQGIYHHGLRTILKYRIGDCEILESPRVIESPMLAPLYARQFQVGPRPKPLVLNVAQAPSSSGNQTHRTVTGRANQVVWIAPSNDANSSDSKSNEAETVRKFRLDGKSYAEVADGTSFDLKSRDFTMAARLRTKVGGTILALTPTGPKWAPDGQSLFVREGRVCFDVGWVGVVSSRRRVDDDRWHDVVVTWQHNSSKLRIFIDGKLDAEGRIAAKQALTESALRIGFTTADFPQPNSYFQGALEEVRLYQRELLESEANRPWPADDESLVGHWRFDKVQQNQIIDLSSKKRHAQVRHGETSVIDRSPRTLIAGIAPSDTKIAWKFVEDHQLRLEIPAGESPLRFTLWTTSQQGSETESLVKQLANETYVPEASLDLNEFTRGGPPRWPQELETRATIGSSNGPFAVDILSHPTNNPWFSQLRLTGFDFFPDGNRVAVCSWDGDVWIVSGLEDLPKATGNEGAAPNVTLRWKRIASGLFQPLGLKIVRDKIHLTCRDQLTVLHDLNGDGETDFYECLNSDHQVTEHFHEFAMGLQTDAAGNFYYAKSARHALPAVVPHHGTLLRVSPDGQRTDILATGFRAANGVCLNPDGTFIVTDQEGHWNPKNRINWVNGEGPHEFFGNMFGYHNVTDSSDSAMRPPLCWITNAFDRSPAELLWVPKAAKGLGWETLSGSLLNLSYGYGKIFIVPHEKVAGQMQGGMCELPLPTFPTGLIRGRFHPGDGQLYACGMFSWAGSATQPGGFYRVRSTGQPVHVPVGLNARLGQVTVTFSSPLDAASVEDMGNFGVKSWSLKRTANYGSQHHDERTLKVERATLSEDRRQLTLMIPELAPTWCMEIKYAVKSAEGAEIRGVIHNTIHKAPSIE
jgi:putative heme-binding domain-containing protein